MATERWRNFESLVHYFLAPLAGAATISALLPPEAITQDAPLAAFLAFSASALVVRRNSHRVSLLPFMRALWHAAAPIFGLVALAVLKLVAVLPGRSSTLLAGTVVTALVSWVPWIARRPGRKAQRRTRLALIGSRASALSLDEELRLTGVTGYLVVGHVDAGETQVGDRAGQPRAPRLGSLGQLRDVIIRHEVDLLVLTREVPRLRVFEKIAESCMDQPVRVWELSALYEELFGHVPVAEVNPAWFQYVLHPKYRHADPAFKRALDVAIAAIVGVLSLPMLGVAAMAIRRDGGPVLFRQLRIGQGGRPFVMNKLRTMKVDAASEAQWASPDDPRVTRLGRLLRRTHIDELPQLLNVLRGEMSVVGPRPEQPEFVAQLERSLQFYDRRHLLKPGITGWAQVRCGYARSDIGSAWKLCHDLYYLKHRSIPLDLVIIGETLRTVFIEASPAVEPAVGPNGANPAVLGHSGPPSG